MNSPIMNSYGRPNDRGWEVEQLINQSVDGPHLTSVIHYFVTTTTTNVITPLEQ
jgi:hypothetical protein